MSPLFLLLPLILLAGAIILWFLPYRGEAERKKGRAYLFVIIPVISFLLAGYVSVAVIGGNAMYGKVEAGKYFVGNHGKLIEVSHRLFIVSQVLDVVIYTSIFAGVVGVIIGAVANYLADNPDVPSQ